MSAAWIRSSMQKIDDFQLMIDVRQLQSLAAVGSQLDTKVKWVVVDLTQMDKHTAVIRDQQTLDVNREGIVKRQVGETDTERQPSPTCT